MSAHWAAIFDWDGVVIDSSRQHERAWERIARERGRALPPGFFKRSFGMKNERVIPELLGWAHDPEEVRQISQRKEALYRDIIRAEGIAPLPGVREWLGQLRTAGVPCVVATSTPRANLDCVMPLLGLNDFFSAVVTAEDVTRGKPHPEVFLIAARKVGMCPSRCVVFEDAHVGIEAARAAGMRVVALATTHPADTLRAADRVVRRLDELSLEELRGWFGTNQPPLRGATRGGSRSPNAIPPSCADHRVRRTRSA
ncbi:MAG: HAD family phosphatase [Verrucomicrobiae bacterium]|nr:HAD family phosphatase [Verrucomicrobiae bacterium]